MANVLWAPWACRCQVKRHPDEVRALSIVLPAFDEEANIARVVRRVVAFFEPRGIDYEIIVVNDGSRDRTGEILNHLASELFRLRPRHHPQNRGYGAALRTGFEAARHAYIFYMDGDGQFDIKDLDRLLPLAGEDCIVSGFRIRRRDSVLRGLNARLFGWLVRVLLDVRVRDLNCAFKLVPKTVIAGLTLESTGALINAELYARAAHRGVRIREVGVNHYPREAGVPTGARLRVIVRAFYELWRLRRKLVSGR
jgi:glycosyltransferase involved in cell wall biosynthesis